MEASEAPEAPPGGASEHKARGGFLEFATIVVVALGLALGIQAFLVKPFRIPSESMVPTLQVGQRVLVDRVSFRLTTPSRGDIVVFKPPLGAETNSCGIRHTPEQPCPEPTRQRSDTNFIKRVVAVPGDRLKVLEGRAYIDGKLQNEPFIRPDAECAICDLPEEIVIPPDHFFMMGDNRGESADSREWGPVPKKWLIGNGFLTYWPPKRIGTL